ncbi:MAG TPA: hypothetical protein VGJ21_11415 [Terracidiphilus sp.]
MADNSSTSTIPQTPAEGKLAAHVVKLFKAVSKSRYAEEREWATAGYFDQLKQWLEEDGANGDKLRPMVKKRGSKWPMPVTNLFSKAIVTNANSLGADIPRMRALSGNYDAQNRRAADAAENVIEAANKESGMDVLNPKLARMIPLWGICAVYDRIAFDHSTVEVPQIPEGVPPPDTAAGIAGAAAAGTAGQDADNQQPGLAVRAPAAPAGAPSAPAAPEVAAPPEIQASGVETIPTARLESILLTPFEFYLPRDCPDPNLAPWRIIRTRRKLGEMKENYPDFEDALTADGNDVNLAFYYLNTLRSLSWQNRQSLDADEPFCTVTELWADWTSIPDEVQDAIEAEWQNAPSDIYGEQGLTKLQAAIEYGLLAVEWNGQIIQWTENPWDGDQQPTFFMWQKDAAAVYPKGLSVELIPLTKSLNRVDSLILREAMSMGTGKWLVPNTQTSLNLSGDPTEAIYWDPMGDGKLRPEFIPAGTNSKLLELRAQIVNDFKDLSFTNSVAEGEMPGAGTAFRLAAYMGAKAEETRKTQRYLNEQSHEIRAEKIIKMARKVWTEPRKVQVRGYNNRYGMQQLDMADLEGEYEIQVIQDSSKPKTMTEKLQVLQMAQQGGYVDPKDTSTREYVLNVLGLDELDESDHLQIVKAERDLEKLKRGIQPMESPFEKWDIPLRVCANFTLTEEFEELPENVRNGILMYAQYISDKLSVANGAPMGVPPPPPGLPPGAPNAGVGGQTASHVLGQVPGAQVSNSQVQGAAVREAADVVPNAPSPRG